MGFISWICLGLVAGLIAKTLMPGKDPGGFFVTIIIGIAGGVLGGFIGRLLGIGTVEGFFHLTSWLLAIAGSVILLILYRLLKKRP